MSSRSRHWGVVTDAGLVARRPIDDLRLRESQSTDGYGIYVGGGLLQHGIRSAPPMSMVTAGIDNAFKVYRDQGQGQVDISATGDRQRLQLQDQTCEWPRDDHQLRPGNGHGGAHSNLFMMTRSSSFRAMPGHDADHRLHDDGMTNAIISATTQPDCSVFPRENIDNAKSSTIGTTDVADFDNIPVGPGPCQSIDGLVADRPTTSGRPAFGSTILQKLAIITTEVKTGLFCNSE